MKQSKSEEIYELENEDVSIRKQKRKFKKTIFKSKTLERDDTLWGMIVASLGSQYIVERENRNGCFDYYECSVGGAIASPHSKSTLACAGDIVKFIPDNKINPSSGMTAGVITEIKDRDKKLSRRAAGRDPYEHVIAANFDTLLIAMSAEFPIYNRRLIDRLAVAAELGCMSAAVCINKIDIAPVDEIADDFEVYQSLGIPVFFFSAVTGERLDEFSKFLDERKSVLLGPSGVGKSTILNRLLGSNQQSVNEISEKTFKGRHTTSHARAFNLPNGAKIIDTPGIREFYLWGVNKDELPLYFHDFDPYYPNCKYPLCSHTHEPDCAVISAVELSKLDLSRYESYLNMFDSLED